MGYGRKERKNFLRVKLKKKKKKKKKRSHSGESHGSNLTSGLCSTAVINSFCLLSGLCSSDDENSDRPPITLKLSSRHDSTGTQGGGPGTVSKDAHMSPLQEAVQELIPAQTGDSAFHYITTVCGQHTDPLVSLSRTSLSVKASFSIQIIYLFSPVISAGFN